MKLPSLRAVAPTVLIAAVYFVTVELLRATSPLLDLAAGEVGTVGAARLAVLIFVAPALVAIPLALAGPSRSLQGAVAVLVLLRVIAQAQDPATLLVVGAGAAAGVATLVLAVRQAPSGLAATVGILAGGVVDLAIRAGYGSWDSVFRPGLLPWLLILVAGAVAVAAAWWSTATADPGPPAAGLGRTPTGRVAVLGLYLSLYVMVFGSAPIVAAHSGWSLPVASIVLIVAAVAGMELVRRARLPGGSGAIPEPDRWFAGLLALLAVIGGVVATYWLTGTVVLATAAVAALAAAVLLSRALTPRVLAAEPAQSPGRVRPAVTVGLCGALAGLGYVLPVMVYQVHFDLEFPFDNRYALVAAALLLGVAGLGGRPREQASDRRGLLARPAGVSVVSALALLVPLAMVVTPPATPEPRQTGATVRLMNWNVMYGRHHTDGLVDLESIAAAIEAEDPDVVLLQEVSRGWPIGGGTDMLEWLSRRLAMPYYWAPAADGLFGNAMLTRLPVSDVKAERYPFIQGPMDRSYQAATLHLADGKELRVYNTHFQHRKENTPTRLAHSEILFEDWGGTPHTIIAGDFNFWPSWEEPLVWEAAGFISAQDAVGDPAEFTIPSDDPDNRVDWIFGTPDLAFSDFEILSEVQNSDHLPLVVTIRLREEGFAAAVAD